MSVQNPGGTAAQPIDLYPGDLQAVASAFAGGQDRLVKTGETLVQSLQACAGMAGNDKYGKKFGKDYDPAAAAVFPALAAAVRAIGGMCTGLVRTANNYLKADQHSNASAAAIGAYQFSTPAVLDDIMFGSPEPAVGGGSGGVPSWLVGVWPNGHQNLLRQAATAWRNAAKDLDGIGRDLHQAVQGITDNNSSASVDAMKQFWSRIWTDGNASKAPLSAARQACEQLAGFCDAYASAIDKAHSSIEQSLALAGIGVLFTSALGLLGTVVTGGASDALAGAADAAEVAAAAAPALGELEADLEAEVVASMVSEIEQYLMAAAESAPELTSVEADTVPVTELDSELAATEDRELAMSGARGRGAARGGGDDKPLRWEGSPKHGATQRGNAAPEPRDPQGSLARSIEFSGNTTRRVSVDYTNDEFCVFDETYNESGIYHGHVRAWNQLSQQMQNALRRAGLVNAKGKILPPAN